MGHFSRALVVAICAAALSACAAKHYTAIPMEQPGDEQLTCVQLKELIAANEKAASDFIKQDKAVENKNVARSVAGVVPFAGILVLLSTDLSNEEQVKARSIVDRNERLMFLSKQKGCSP